MASDIFISYRRKDSERVMPLVPALPAEGVSPWLDQSEIGEFAPITDPIRKGLGDLKALLAWYSADYPKSRPCQMELTAAFVAAQREGDPRRRVLVVNPEDMPAHIEPIELRDAQYAGGRSGLCGARHCEHCFSGVSRMATHRGRRHALRRPAHREGLR